MHFVEQYSRYSALKRGGQRLSDLARAGQEVMPKPPRKVKVYHLECTDFNPPYFSIGKTFPLLCRIHYKYEKLNFTF